MPEARALTDSFKVLLSGVRHLPAKLALKAALLPFPRQHPTLFPHMRRQLGAVLHVHRQLPKVVQDAYTFRARVV